MTRIKAGEGKLRLHCPGSGKPDSGEKALHEDALFGAIAAAIPDGLITIDERGVIHTFNPGAVRLFGYAASEAVGRNVSMLMPSPDREAHDSYIARYVESGVKHVIGAGREVTGQHKDGHTFPCYLSVGEAGDGQGRIFVGIVHDLTEFKRKEEQAQRAEALRHLNSLLQKEVARREQAEQALIGEKERYQVTLASIGEAVISTDEHGKVVFLNSMAEQLTGWPAKDALGQSLPRVFQAVDETTRQPLEYLLELCLAGNKTALPENALLIRRDGEQLVVEDAISPIKNASGAIIGSVMTFRDVSEKRDAARRLAHQATHDSLTGLINRAEFERRLKRVLDSRQPHDAHALLYLDLDQFKIVNDTCGHVAGDELLRQIAGLLRSRARKRDTLARLGGDEFGALLEHCSLEQAEHIAEQLRRAVYEFQFRWQERRFNVGVSIGLVPLTEASGAFQEIMSAADSACYVAKEQGRNRIHVFRADDRALAQRYGQMRWIPRIQRALEENRFRLDLQPIVSLSNPQSRAEHAEVLLRMLDENGEVVTPGAFIPAAERFDQMLALDKWVIEHTLDAIRGVPLERRLKTISVNISAQSLCDRQFLQFVAGAARKGDCASTLCFEITETAAITNHQHAMEFVSELRSMGCRFALDDFGSGLSSFSYLKSLRVDYLKIDGRFISGMLGDAVDSAVVKAIHQIAHVMNIKTIAEYVEDERTMMQLKKMGVDFAQGWYFGRPYPMDVLLNMDLPAETERRPAPIRNGTHTAKERLAR
ncbi:MAG: EAL domain-containing protein [Burkholderiales bacterium]